MKRAPVPHAKEDAAAELHEAVGKELVEAGASTLVERWWSWVGRAIAAVARAKSPVPFWVRAVCTFALALLLDFGLTLAVQPEAFRQFVGKDCMWAAFTLSFVLVMHAQFLHYLDVFRIEVLPKISAADLADVREWMRWLRWIQPQAAFTLLGGALGALFSNTLIRQSGTAPGAGQLLLYFVDFSLMSMLVYNALPLILLYLRIGSYQVSVYTLDPADSAVLNAMYNLANGFSLAFAALVALFMVLIMRVYGSSASLGVSFLVLALFTWMPILAFFAISQRAFAQIITRAREGKLAEIQQKILEIEARADLAKKESVDLLKSLLDYYQRVADTPNSMLNGQVIVNLVSSLILPVIGLVASNYERILRILGVRR